MRKETVEETLQLIGRLALALAACLSICAPCFGRDGEDLLANKQPAKLDHGLYEIREAGREFLARKRHRKGMWKAIDPDMRIIFPRCAGPLRTRWSVKADLEKNEGVQGPLHEFR